jgi:hypothetical protein
MRSVISDGGEVIRFETIARSGLRLDRVSRSESGCRYEGRNPVDPHPEPEDLIMSLSVPLPRIALALLLFLAVTINACSSPTAPADSDAFAYLPTRQAALQGRTLDGLRNAGWDCQQRGPSAIACAPPGIGLPPIPPLGENGRPTYELAVFTLDGTPIGTTHFVRADLYNGWTCAFTGQPFVFRALIGYYECFRAS